MRIVKINIVQFGKLRDLAITPSEGLTVIQGDNESGKSTLIAFIKFVFYGLGRKNPSIAVGERERALPWSTGTASGSLTVTDDDGNSYVIERSGREGARSSYIDKVRVIDLSDGREVFEGEVPGEHFLGVGAAAFDSTCCIRQLECSSLSRDAIRESIDNLLSSGDESTSVQAALKLLDTERRRLLHANGRGGLIYESEARAERLRSEYRGAIAFENECIKNTDELDRVTLSLDKARAEHTIAQRMCDAHDDVRRLEKSDELRERRARSASLSEQRAALRESAGFNASLASYEQAAALGAARDALGRSEDAVRSARAEYDSAEASLRALPGERGENFPEIITEFGSPEGVVSFLRTKEAKKNRSSLLCAVLGAFGAILLICAILLTALSDNFAGSLTVAFIGIIPVILAFDFYKKFISARGEIRDLLDRMSLEGERIDEYEIISALTSFSEDDSLRSRYKNALESAKFRLSMAEEALESDRAAAISLLSHFETDFTEGEERAALCELLEKINSYLAQSSCLEREESENATLIRSLAEELSRFDERAIRERTTPEMIEKIKNASFERLKSERDAALYRVNQYNQYKASIERNLASAGSRPSSADIFPELEAEEERLRTLRLRLDAVKLAAETVSGASASLKSGIVPKIKDGAEDAFSKITGGKYSSLFLDDDMNLSVLAEGEIRNIASLSRGSLDAAYLAVRLSLVRTLIPGKTAPLCMDEPLSQLDDGRAAGVLHALASRVASGTQCILLTCQDRDVRLARSILPDTQVVVLE